MLLKRNHALCRDGFSLKVEKPVERPCYTRLFFLQLVSQHWRLKNIASCRGGVTRSQYFFATCFAPTGNCLQLFLCQLEIFCEQKTGSDCLIFHKIALQISMDMSHTGYFYFSCNSTDATFCCRCRLQNWGVTREIFLATCLATFVARLVQEKLPRVTSPERASFF